MIFFNKNTAPIELPWQTITITPPKHTRAHTHTHIPLILPAMLEQNKISTKCITHLHTPEQQDVTQYIGHQFSTCKNTIKNAIMLHVDIKNIFSTH
jgi:hypothetical protein